MTKLKVTSGTGAVNVHPGPMTEARFYVPLCLPSKWKCVSLYIRDRGRDALMDDTLKEMSRLHGTASNTIQFSCYLVPWLLFFMLNYCGNLHEKGTFVSASSFAPVTIYSSLHCHSSSQQREGDYSK